MSGKEFDTPATNLGELGIHLGYLRAEVHRLVQAMPHMATKTDIDNLARKFEQYATQDDMRAMRTDVEMLRLRVVDGAVGTTFDRGISFVTRVGGAAAVLAACSASIAAFVHFLDRVPK